MIPNNIFGYLESARRNALLSTEEAAVLKSGAVPAHLVPVSLSAETQPAVLKIKDVPVLVFHIFCHFPRPDIPPRSASV